MDDKNDNVMQKLVDTFMLDALVGILNELDNTEIKLLPFLAKNCAQNGMPIKNIMPFLDNLGKFLSEKSQERKLRAQDAQELQDLFARSGFMTVGFSQDTEGGDKRDGDGRDGA